MFCAILNHLYSIIFIQKLNPVSCYLCWTYFFQGLEFFYTTFLYICKEELIWCVQQKVVLVVDNCIVGDIPGPLTNKTGKRYLSNHVAQTSPKTYSEVTPIILHSNPYIWTLLATLVLYICTITHWNDITLLTECYKCDLLQEKIVWWKEIFFHPNLSVDSISWWWSPKKPQIKYLKPSVLVKCYLQTNNNRLYIDKSY